MLQESSEQRIYLHPLVAKLIEEYSCPSPGRVPRDPDQPRHGSFKELKLNRPLPPPSSSQLSKTHLFHALRLNNPSLNPVSGVDFHLSPPLSSSLLQRRALNKQF